jgi:hypothetical protein
MIPQPFSRSAVFWIVDIDHDDLAAEIGERLLHRRRVFAVGDQHPGLAVVEHEADGFRIKPGVQGV